MWSYFFNIWGNYFHQNDLLVPPGICINDKMLTYHILFQDDGWDTEPFVLTEIDGKLFGRGSTDDKVKVTD